MKLFSCSKFIISNTRAVFSFCEAGTRREGAEDEEEDRESLNNELLRNSNLFRHPSCFHYEALSRLGIS
jgi:hypothetical protein